jgi:hypothetical protein
VAWRRFFSICPSESRQVVPKLQIPDNVADQDKILLLLSIKSNLLFLNLDTKEKEQVFKMAIEDANTSKAVYQGGMTQLEALDGQIQAIALFQAQLIGGVKPVTQSSEDRPHLKP